MRSLKTFSLCKINLNDQIKEDAMSSACSTNWEEKKEEECMKDIGGKAGSI
jgi:hypothetical protein